MDIVAERAQGLELIRKSLQETAHPKDDSIRRVRGVAYRTATPPNERAHP
jgi:hypothetical protein